METFWTGIVVVIITSSLLVFLTWKRFGELNLRVVVVILGGSSWSANSFSQWLLSLDLSISGLFLSMIFVVSITVVILQGFEAFLKTLKFADLRHWLTLQYLMTAALVVTTVLARNQGNLLWLVLSLLAISIFGYLAGKWNHSSEYANWAVVTKDFLGLTSIPAFGGFISSLAYNEWLLSSFWVNAVGIIALTIGLVIFHKAEKIGDPHL